MKNGEQSAYPGYQSMLIGDTEQMVPTVGLTKREYFAAMAMQGLVAKEGWSERFLKEDGDSTLIIDIASASVKIANELLKQLES